MRIEEQIQALGLPATILRPVSFMDNFSSLSRPALEDGELVISLALRPQTPLPLVAVRDIGTFAAIAFENPGTYIGRHLDLAGDCLTGPQIADVFARVCGLPARFRQVPIERLRAFDPEVARMFEWMDTRAPEESNLSQEAGPERLRAVHPGLMTLETWLRATQWRPEPPRQPAAATGKEAE